MKEKLQDVTVDVLLNGIQNKVSEVKDNFEWKNLFIDTGSFLISNQDTLKSFQDDLFVVFSEDNMKEISRKLRDARGYEFPQLLHDDLYDLMIRYEIPKVDAESYIHHFMQMIIGYLEKNDSNKTLEIYLGAWRKEEENNFDRIRIQMDSILKEIKDLKKIEVSSYSIADIDVQIRKTSLYKGMNLDFFEVDDEQFETKFENVINNERVFIVGKSREETLYRILNEIRKKYDDRVTLIIKNETEWKKLDTGILSGKILIPFFYDDSIEAIPNNTNIFIYGEDEPCYSNNKIELRRRTKQGIIHSLEKIGIDGNEAYNMVNNTHGLYVPMKKKLFNGAMHNRPKWVNVHSDAVMAALLCGKWTEADGDILIFEELAGKKYDECKKELESYAYGENPYIIKDYRGSDMQLASVEDAWEELDIYISDELWNNFIKLFYEVLIESEPIFDYPFEKHFEASIYAGKAEWSPTLKRGMVRTLIMRAYYRGHEEYQRQIDHVVGQVLDTITTKERWGYISQYMTDLCEASPKAVLEKLEREFSNPTGLVDLFAVNESDFIVGRHYYTHVLWAVEQLLQQKKYAVRAVEWLWKMNSYEIEYSINKSPKSILDVVFCAWLNACALSADDKIDLAKKAIELYPNAWEIILSKLSDRGRSIWLALNSPKYRRVDEPEELYKHQVNKTYIEYLRMYIDCINNDVNKWIKIIGHLGRYAGKYQEEVLAKLCVDCKTMSDQDKSKIKNKIRYYIYRERFFADADWSIPESQLEKYENILNEISVDDKVYDYIYLFSSTFEFPLLHPVSYNREDNRSVIRDENDLLREKEIKSQIKIFKEKKYSLKKLIELVVKDDKACLGEVLAQFYCNGNFNEKVFELLLENDKEGKHVYNYIRFLCRKEGIKLNDILNKVKKTTNNENLLINLISLEVIEDGESAIIAHENNEIKKAYWSKSFRCRLSENASRKVCLWALDECHKYGTLETYLELLFDLKDKFNEIQLYELVLVITDMRSDNFNTMTKYYLQQILIIIQKCFLYDIEKCQEIALLEWMCRNVLDWEEMKCLQYLMKLDPNIYAIFVRIIFKSDKDGEVVDKERSDLVKEIYPTFHKAKFCPAEKEGKVTYESIKEWVDKFKKLLIDQKQYKLFGTLIGALLAHSPKGEDGYMPCEAVRDIIEEYYSDSLKTSYAVEEENKRGVHGVNAGKSELKLHQKYKSNAEWLQCKYPRTAEIYFELSDSYKQQADWERRRAEDEW